MDRLFRPGTLGLGPSLWTWSVTLDLRFRPGTLGLGPSLWTWSVTLDIRFRHGTLGLGPSLWTLILVLVRPFGFSIHSVRQVGPGPSLWALDCRLIRSVTLDLRFRPVTLGLGPSFWTWSVTLDLLFRPGTLGLGPRSVTLDLVRHCGPSLTTWYFRFLSVILGFHLSTCV